MSTKEVTRDLIHEINQALSNPNTSTFSRWWVLQCRAFLHLEGLGGPIDFKAALKCHQEAKNLGISVAPKKDIKSQLEATSYEYRDLYPIFRYIEILLNRYQNTTKKTQEEWLEPPPMDRSFDNEILYRYCSYRQSTHSNFSIFHLNLLKITTINEFPDWMKLFKAVQNIKQQGRKLVFQGIQKGYTLIELQQNLDSLLLDFICSTLNTKPTESEFNYFKLMFILSMKDKLQEIQTHRHPWKFILFNILIGLTVVGIIPIGIKLITHLINISTQHQPFMLSHALFFGKAKSENLYDDTEAAILAIRI